MMFTISSAAFLLCIVPLSSPLENSAQVLDKPIESTATVVCTGCGNGSSCIITVNNVAVDEDNYMISDNGILTVPANDVSVYAIMSCGGSIEQLRTYQICPPYPPYNGKYNDWLNITSSGNMITVGGSVEISATFLHLCHSGITIEVNGSVSGDDDLSCTTNTWVRNTVVNYTCIARRPGVKEVKVQLTFCDIDFNSSIFITIKEPDPLNQSTSTSTPMTDSISSVSSGMMSISSGTTTRSNVLPSVTPTNSSSFSSTLQTIIMTASSSSSSPSPSSSVAIETSMPTEDDQLSEGGIAAITVSTVFSTIAIVGIVISLICIYVKWFRSTAAGNAISIQNNLHISLNGNVPIGNGSVPIGNGNVPTSNGGTHTGNDDAHTGNDDIHTDNGDGDVSAANGNIPTGDNGNNANSLTNDNDDYNHHQVHSDEDDVPTANAETQDDEKHGVETGFPEVDTTNERFAECSSSGQNLQQASLALH